MTVLRQASFSSPTKRARGEASRSELGSIVEYSNDAIFSRTFEGNVTTWNAAAQRIFGFSADEIVGRSSQVLLPPGHQDEFRRLVRRLRQGRVVEHLETERQRKDGRRIHVSLTLSPIRNESGRLVGYSTIARDITAQRQMREALARRERELEDLFDEASVGLALVSCRGKVLRANKAFGEMIGVPARQVTGRLLRSFHPHAELLNEMLDRLARRETLHNFPTELRNRKGGLTSVLIDANTLWEAGVFVHSRWFIRDISQRKRLERELLEVSERERRQFAQELHDGLGQQLGGIAYLSSVLRDTLRECKAPEADDAGRVFALTRSAIEQVRRVARGLSPIQPGPEGLMDALRELAVQTTEVFGVRCVLECDGHAWVQDTETAAHLFRIGQEAVHNALKHAKPRIITLRLKRDGTKISLMVRDDGIGMPPVSPRRKGLGLRIMEYRSSLVRGTLTVRRLRRGTEVQCSTICPAAGMT